MRGFLVGAAALCIVFGACSAIAADTDEVSPVTALLQTNDVVVNPDGSYVQTSHTELHADNDAGAMRLGQVQLTFNQARQDLQVVEAYTLKPDGTKIPVDMSAIYVRLPPDDAQDGMVTDLRMKVIVFPQMAAGDTAVYTVKSVNASPIFPGSFTYGKAFLPSSRLKEVRDTITAPKSLNLRVENHNIAFTQQDQGSNTVYSWHWSNPSPHAVKLPSVSPMDQLPRYFVSNFKDYADLGRAYNALAGSKVTVTPKVQELADKVTAGVTDQREQARKIYEWVTSHVRYIALELGESTFVPHNVDDILGYGYGDCKDHDVIVRSLLKAKGIESQSVLLNSSNAYTLTEVPTFAQLDHVISYVPSLNLYIDSSNPLTPFGSLPYAEYGKPVIYVSAEGARLGTMPSLQPGLASEYTKNVMTLSATGVLTGTTTTTAEGPSSILLRLIGLAVQAIGPEKAASTMLESHGYKGATGTLKGGPPLVPGKSYTVSGNFTSAGWGDWLTGDKVAYMPIGLRVLGLTGDGPMGNVSEDANDTSPTPCFSVHQSEDDTLQIPANARFASVPTDSHVSTANIEFTAHWTLANNTLSVHRDFLSRIDQPLCTGAVRSQTARALLEIAISYLGQIRILPSGGSSGLVSQNNVKPLLGPKPLNSREQIAFNDAIAAAKIGDSDRAVRLISTLMAANHTDTADGTYTSHLAQGLAYLQSSQFDAAVSELTEAIRLNPDAGPQPYSARASAYSRMGKSRLAAADLETALKSSPDDLKLRQTHAELLAQLHDYDGAAADMNLVVRAHPDDRALVLERAGIRYHADKYDEAAADFTHAERLGADAKDVRPGLCNSLARTDAFAQAIGHCSWVIGQDAQSVAGLESRGYAYFRLGKYAQALADFSAAARIDAGDPRYLYERGVAKLKTGDKSGQADIEAATKAVPRIAHKVPEKLAL
ncbi:MAG: DUF3857 domain-containing protein [Alphaproteobacteria bacterium]|nr:DUF3857 domain-containing protein [Alphaproteobacteria bacterium]